MSRKPNRPCGNSKCAISMAIDETTFTFGSGRLDDYGFWSRPCRICAEAYEKAHPDERAWPGPREEAELGA